MRRGGSHERIRDGDCCDTDAEVHPEAALHDAPYACDAAGLPSFDWDCDGLETRESTALASDCAADLLSCLGVAPGWCAVDVRHPACTGVPDCGAGGIWQAGCTLVPSPDAGTGGSAVVDASGARRPDAGLPDGRDARRSDAGDARTAKESPARDDGSRDDAWESGEVSGWVCVASLEPRTQRCR